MNSRPSHLQRFFSEIIGYFEGKNDFGADTLGVSDSSSARFEFYRDMVRANRERPIGRCFQATFRLLRLAGFTDADVVERHKQDNPPDHGDYASLALGFSLVVEKLAAGDAQNLLLQAAAEVADYEELRQLLTTFEPRGMFQAPFVASLHARHYTVDVRHFSKAVRDGDPLETPRSRPHTLFLWQDSDDGTFRTHVANELEILVAGVLTGEMSVSEAASLGVDDGSIELVRIRFEKLRLVDRTTRASGS